MIKLSVEIENLSEAQAASIRDFLITLQMLGNIGSSRKVSLYADGDGRFKPQITVNGTSLVNTPSPDHWYREHEQIDPDGYGYYLFDEDDY